MSAKLLPMWRPYRPSNGTEGQFFYEAWCAKCSRDAAFRNNDNDRPRGCSIIARALIYDLDDPQYPKEWIQGTDDGVFSETRCTAFTPLSVLSDRARRAWESRRAARSASFAGDLFAAGRKPGEGEER